MNEGIHLDLDTWIVPGHIRKANLCRGLGNRYKPAGTEVLISAVAHNTPPPFQAAQNATTVFEVCGKQQTGKYHLLCSIISASSQPVDVAIMSHI